MNLRRGSYVRQNWLGIAEAKQVQDAGIIVERGWSLQMPFPNLDQSQLAWVTQQVAAYIDQHRQTFRGRAVPLEANQRTAMQPFFQAIALDSARLILLGEHASNPPFYCELVQMGFDPASLPNFTEMAAITFVDTVVFHVPLTVRTLFHELVHVIQYRKLGLADFAAKYVMGFLTGGSYEAIPLERNAYELDGRFASAPSNHFSVEAEIQSWIDANKF